MNNKKVGIYLLFTIFCMILIFTFSSKNSRSSNGVSMGLIDQGITIYERLSNQSVNHERVIQKLNYPIRKLAHYSLYFLLGIFVYFLVYYSKCKYKIIISIGICFFYAILDEVHQLFVLGRTGQPFDVFIDTFGFTTAIFLLCFLKKRGKFSSQKVAQESKI